MRIYVGNLPYETSETELQGLFSQHGSVGEIVFPIDRDSGRPKGFAFVEMPNDEEAQKAISALNNYAMGNRTLTVNEARPRPAGGGFGGGGGGGFRGGGGGGGFRGGGGRGGKDRDRGRGRR